MRLLYINNDGGGFADYVEVRTGTTVSQFFDDRLPGREPSDYLIRVNRQPVPRDYVLQEGDRVSATPTKIEGARNTHHAARTCYFTARIAHSRNRVTLDPPRRPRTRAFPCARLPLPV